MSSDDAVTKRERSPPTAERLSPPTRKLRCDAAHAGDTELAAGSHTNPQAWVAPGLESVSSWTQGGKLVTVSLGQRDVDRAVAAGWHVGTVLTCPNQGTCCLEICVDGIPIARGMPVLVDERLCVQVTELLTAPPDLAHSDNHSNSGKQHRTESVGRAVRLQSEEI